MQELQASMAELRQGIKILIHHMEAQRMLPKGAAQSLMGLTHSRTMVGMYGTSSAPPSPR
jgi:hypothetical protein